MLYYSKKNGLQMSIFFGSIKKTTFFTRYKNLIQTGGSKFCVAADRFVGNVFNNDWNEMVKLLHVYAPG